MASLMRPMAVRLFSKDWRASFAMRSAWRALSLFCLVMEDISSREAEVSSREEACSLAPSAICWLLWLTWLEAEDTCSLPEDSELMTCVRAEEIERLRKMPMEAPIAKAANKP